MPLATWIELNAQLQSLDARLRAASHATTSAFLVSRLEKVRFDGE
jgi:hypothetical protein